VTSKMPDNATLSVVMRGRHAVRFLAEIDGITARPNARETGH
jgi:hypothetical protein